MASGGAKRVDSGYDDLGTTRAVTLVFFFVTAPHQLRITARYSESRWSL